MGHVASCGHGELRADERDRDRCGIGKMKRWDLQRSMVSAPVHAWTDFRLYIAISF